VLQGRVTHEKREVLTNTAALSMRYFRPLLALSTKAFQRSYLPPVSQKRPIFRSNKVPFASTSGPKFPRHLHRIPAVDMEKVDTSSRLASLRNLMRENNVDIYSKMANIPRFESPLGRQLTSAVKLSRPKIAILQSTSHHATLGESSSLASPARQGVL
jgi:hypothetical protein